MKADCDEQWNVLWLATPWHKKRYTPANQRTALRRWLIHIIERTVWGYGIKPLSLFWVAALILFINSSTLWLAGIELRITGEPEANSQGFMTCLYAVAVTFSTLGFGDVVPSEWFGRIVLSLTGLVGPVCLGLLVAAAYRRIQR